MATYTKHVLSQSVSGESILIELSASPGNLLHTASTTDEVWLYASNNTTADCILTLNWGTSGDRDLVSKVAIQAYAGPILLIPGLVLTSGASVYAYTSALSSVNILGYVNRIT